MSESVPPVDKSGERVKQMFASIARHYDLMNHVLSLNIDRYWRRFTVAQVPPVGSLPILDVCAGTGDLALAYARVASKDTPIIGLDFCRPMLVHAARKDQRAFAGRVTWIEGDALALPFPDHVFQIVTVAFGLRNVADTERGLAELVRVTQPGGRVVILEFSKPRLWGLRHLYLWYFRHVLPRIGQTLARNGESAYDYLPASVLAFPDGEHMVEFMSAAGLEKVRFTPLTGGIATLYIGTKPGSDAEAGL